MTLGGHEEDRYRSSLAIHVHPHARTCTCRAHVCSTHENRHVSSQWNMRGRIFVKERERERERKRANEEASCIVTEFLIDSRSISQRPRLIMARVTDLTGVGRSIVLDLFLTYVNHRLFHENPTYFLGNIGRLTRFES